MKGHEALVALRKAGRVPARGVVIDAGRSGFNDCETWARLSWPRAFVEVAERDRIDRLDLCWTVALRVVLVRQPQFPMADFSKLTKAVLLHKPDVLTALVFTDDGRGEPSIHHHRAGTWAKGWAPEELADAAKGWPTWEQVCN